MEIIKHTDSSFVIKDDATVVSFLIFGILLLIAIAFYVTLPDMAGMGLLCLFVAAVYFFTGHLSRTYFFDKHDKKFSLNETAFFKTSKKHYALDDIQSIVFVPITSQRLIFGFATAVGALLGPESMVVLLKTGKKVEIKPRTSNYAKYVFDNDLVALNGTEAKVGKELAEFLHVPFEIKQRYELDNTKGPSKQFIQSLLKLVYALLLFLAIFIVIVLLAGIFNRLMNL